MIISLYVDTVNYLHTDEEYFGYVFFKVRFAYNLKRTD